MVKLVHNAKKNRYIRTHFSFFLATPYLLSYPLQSFGGKFKIVNFYKQLDFYMVPLKFVCKIHHHYYSSNHNKYISTKQYICTLLYMYDNASVVNFDTQPKLGKQIKILYCNFHAPFLLFSLQFW